MEHIIYDAKTIYLAQNEFHEANLNKDHELFSKHHSIEDKIDKDAPMTFPTNQNQNPLVRILGVHSLHSQN